jgi:hypothetical protein
MKIWSERNKSLILLDNELYREGKVVQEGFGYLESLVELFQKISSSKGESETGQFCRICSITLAKFSHLSLGCFSLALDALSQESGALLRPLIETYELLVYFRQDISRINELLEDKLPSAGVIGKRISGDYQDLRKYLNDNASHFSYKIESVRHLIDGNSKVKLIPNQRLDVLRKNLSVLNAFQIFMLLEAINCLFTIDYDANSLGNDIEKWRDNSIKAFLAIK